MSLEENVSAFVACKIVDYFFLNGKRNRDIDSGYIYGRWKRCHDKCVLHWLLTCDINKTIYGRVQRQTVASIYGHDADINACV